MFANLFARRGVGRWGSRVGSPKFQNISISCRFSSSKLITSNAFDSSASELHRFLSGYGSDYYRANGSSEQPKSKQAYYSHLGLPFDSSRRFNIIIINVNIIYPSTARAVGAPQMISQPLSSHFPCSLLPSGTLQTPGLSIPSCCRPTSSSVCIVFFPLSLCFAT